jgi:hypothetical protein
LIRSIQAGFESTDFAGDGCGVAAMAGCAASGSLAPATAGLGLSG